MDQTPLRLLGLGESPRSYVFEFSSWNIQKGKNGGATTTPPFRAECQNRRESGLSLTLPRLLLGEFSASFSAEIHLYIVVVFIKKLLHNYIYQKERCGSMSKDKMEYQVITMRIPKKMYAEYKEILKNEGKIVTYEVRNYMRDYIENYKKEGAK